MISLCVVINIQRYILNLKMLSFGQLKNLLKRFQDCNKAMLILQNLNYPRSIFQQKQIKQQPLQFYLRVIHYVLVQYSPELYKVILDMIPNIKAMTDQKFVESAFAIGRKVFNMMPVITVDQFLMQGKWIEKKIEFVVELCQGVSKWENNLKKKGGKDMKAGNQLKNYMKETQIINKYAPQRETRVIDNANDSDDEDEEILMQRQITIKPTSIDSVIPNNNTTFGKPMPVDNVKPSRMNQTKPNVFPKGLKNQFIDDEEEEDSNEFIQTTKISQKRIEQPQNKFQQISKPKPKTYSDPPPPPPPHDQSTQHVTKQQFNQVLEMLSSINGTVNGLVSKFNNFQSNVTAWFNNTNARIVLLQENVKMIKSNL